MILDIYLAMTGLQGTPTAVVPAGIDLFTNAIAQMIALSPISISWRAVIDVRIPIYAPSLNRAFS